MSLFVDIQKRCGTFSLRVRLEAENEILGLLGESGSGKSMALRCIAGILKPDSGSIVLDGRVLFDSEKKINLPARQRNVGLMFQSYALFPHMTVTENITAGVRDRAKRDQKRREAVALLRLEGLENRYPHQLSGGQQQRVALARIMACEPALLMLDEPFSALDGHLRHEIDPEFTAALGAFSGTVVYVSHSISEVYRYCGKTAAMGNGQILESGDTETLFTRPRKLGTAKLLCCKNIVKVRQEGETLRAESWNLTLPMAWEFSSAERSPDGAASPRSAEIALHGAESSPPGAGSTPHCTHAGIHSDDILVSAAPKEGFFPAQVIQVAMRPRHGVVRLKPQGALETMTASMPRDTALALDSTAFVRLPPEKILFLEE